MLRSIHAILTLLGREIRAYFVSPLAYIILSFFLALSGFFFCLNLGYTLEATLRPVLSPIAFLSMMMVPLLSMRLIAEEKRTGTLELLLTAPVTTFDVVVAKFLGALLFYMFLISPTLLYIGIFWKYGGNWPFYPTLTFYLGLFLLASAYLSLGIFVSSLTSNQIVASFVTFVVLLLIYLLFLVEQYLPAYSLSKVASYCSWFNHLDSFQKGILDSRDLIYFFSITLFFLFLTVVTLEWKRERSPA